jgi:hypothetical protein
MKFWGLGMLVLSSGAVLAAIKNWDWWFKISSAGGRFVHDAFGRMFARKLNFFVGAILLFVGVADVSGAWPVSKFLNAWVFQDRSGREVIIAPEPEHGATEYSPSASTVGQVGASGLPTYSR